MSWVLHRGVASVPVRSLLIGVAGPEEEILLEIATHELTAER